MAALIGTELVQVLPIASTGAPSAGTEYVTTQAIANLGGGSGSGTVTTVAVATANGFAGTVANPTTTPAITLTVPASGILKSNGTAISAATSGTDYAPGTSANTTGLVKSTTGTGALTTAVAGTDYQTPISLTTTGSSGAATFNTGTGALNIPQYSGGGSGITRSVNSVSSPTTAGSAALTDYAYFVTGTTTITLPTAVGNTNLYTIKRAGTNTVTIATTSAQTIDGAVSLSLVAQYQSYQLISDGANWNIVA